jgi:hypothetical protein
MALASYANPQSSEASPGAAAQGLPPGKIFRGLVLPLGVISSTFLMLFPERQVSDKPLLSRRTHMVASENIFVDALCVLRC